MALQWAAGIFLLSNALLIFSEPVRRAEDKRCGVDVSARQNCGEASSDVECASRGCCYDPCIGNNCAPGVPKCYLSSYMIEGQECQVDESSRQDCGFPGISLDVCLIRGCCWKPSPISGAPWCFHSSTQPGGIAEGSTPVSNPPGLEWKSFENGNLPRRSEAVALRDYSMDVYYVGRITALGGVFPSKIHTHWGAAYFGLDGLELTSKNYDALIVKDSNLKLSWVAASGGEVPSRAVVGGHAINDASHLYYVASGQTRVGDQPGYLDPEEGCTTIGYGWGSKCYESYKVLVWESS